MMEPNNGEIKTEILASCALQLEESMKKERSRNVFCTFSSPFLA